MAEFVMSIGRIVLYNTTSDFFFKDNTTSDDVN